MSAPVSVASPVVVWARARPKWRGVSWEVLEAHLFAAHPDLQLLLRIRGHVLPWKGVWQFAAWLLVLTAILPFLWFGASQPLAAGLTTGAMMLAAAGCQITGFVRGFRGYGTAADAFWGFAVFATSFLPLIGIGAFDSRLGDDGATALFWISMTVPLLCFTGFASFSMTPAKGSARYRRALAAIAALPQGERERLRADLEAALDVLVERRLIGTQDRKRALATPLGGLADAHTNRNPS